MVYVIAQLSIHDRERYERYAGGFMDALRQFQGRRIAAAEGPVLVVHGIQPRA